MAGGLRKGDAGVLAVPPPSPSGPWRGGGASFSCNRSISHVDFLPHIVCCSVSFLCSRGLKDEL